MHITGIGAGKRASSMKAFVAVEKNDESVMREGRGEIFQVPSALHSGALIMDWDSTEEVCESVAKKQF